MSRYGLRSSSRRSGSSKKEEDAAGSDEESEQVDIDFSKTESGRKVEHLVTRLKEEHDFAITDSGRTLYYLSDSEQSAAVPPTAPVPVPVGVPTQQRSAARPIPVPNTADSQAAGSHGSSASAFISGIMNPRSGSENNTPLASNAQLVHSPPVEASYEARHFGKRIRSGSISQRLLSAADLEDIALLDKHQKGILRDLIISGDEDLQYALERYKQGDKATLENMMPALLNRAASENIDLLGELDEDLGFLAVGDHDYSGISGGHGGIIHPAAVCVDQPMPPPEASHTHLTTRSMPIPMQPPPNFPTKQQVKQMTAPNMGPSPHANKVSPATYEGDDGIGDLDFEGGLDVGEEYLLPTFGSNTSNKQFAHSPTILEQQQRFRSNSLAFGALLNETPNSSRGKEVYGRWMDPQAPHDATDMQQRRQASQQQQQNVMSSSGAGAGVNAGLILHDPSGSSGTLQQGRGQGGIGASLAQYGRSKSDSKLTKAMLAEERRREKREKREQKEREKREKKERREQQMREKKERDAREKQEKKDKKAVALKDRHEKEEDEDERMETPSGLGRPRSMSDPNLTVSTDANGLLQVERPDGWVGAYSPESRKMRIERFLEKRNHRVWTKKVKYDVRKNFADSRLRVKGRFVKKEDEMLMRDLMSLT